MLMDDSSPARLAQTRDFAPVRGLAQLGARESELTVDATWATRDGAADTLTVRVGVPRHLLQGFLRSDAILVGGLRVTDELTEVGALGSVLLREGLAALFALQHVGLGHCRYLSETTYGRGN